jgi:hypothetical protein
VTLFGIAAHAVRVEVMAETYQSFSFPAQAAARRGEWNDVAAVLDWLGSADLSCHPINTYGPRRRGEPHNLSLFALLTLFDIACHAARNLHHSLIITRTRFG